MNPAQSQHLVNPGETPSQNEIIAARLAMTPGEWVSVLELSQISGSLAAHSRINDLRQKGHNIEQKSDRDGRRVLSSYRLIPPPEEAPGDLASALASEYQT